MADTSITELQNVIDTMVVALLGAETPYRVEVQQAGAAVEFVIDATPNGGRLVGKEGKTIKAVRRIAQAVGARQGLVVELRTADRPPMERV